MSLLFWCVHCVQSSINTRLTVHNLKPTRFLVSTNTHETRWLFRKAQFASRLFMDNFEKRTMKPSDKAPSTGRLKSSCCFSSEKSIFLSYAFQCVHPHSHQRLCMACVCAEYSTTTTHIYTLFFSFCASHTFQMI